MHNVKIFIATNGECHVICPEKFGALSKKCAKQLESAAASISLESFGKDGQRNSFFSEHKGQIVQCITESVPRSAYPGRDNNYVRWATYRKLETLGYTEYKADQARFDKAVAMRMDTPVSVKMITLGTSVMEKV